MESEVRAKLKKKKEDIATRFKPGSLAYHGCELFSTFLRFHLHEPQRAKEDPLHNEFVQKLSKGNEIKLEDILQYEHLTEEDTLSSPDEWKFATMLVANNQERLNISRFKAQLWAKQNKTYVFKWRTTLGKHENKPPTNHMGNILEENAFFWQFWVPGAPAFLTHDINGELGLVNGAPITTHSLTFTDIGEHERIESILQGENPPPFGTEIAVKEPLSVNVIVNESLDDKPISSHRQKQLDALREFSMSNQGQQIILPITKQMFKGSQERKWYSYETHNVFSPMARVKMKQPFPYDLAFSITAHKAQGRTIKRLVVDLTSRIKWCSQMKYASLFVAMSRSKQRQHIRLLQHRKHALQTNPSDDYKCITSLSPNQFAMAFYHGYPTAQGSPWNWKKALTYS